MVRRGPGWGLPGDRRSLSLSLYRDEDYPQVQALLRYPDRSHVHLDWQGVEEWFRNPAVTAGLGWQSESLAALMAVSPPLAGASWLRVVALRGGVPIESTVRQLWAYLESPLRQRGVSRVCALSMEGWLGRALAGADFFHVDDVVTMRYIGGERRSLPPPERHDLILRDAQAVDIPAVVALDHAAFEPVWRMGADDVMAASREAVSFTVAELEGEVVAYELTIPHGPGVHLVRLATAPEMQGQGVGGALLRWALLRFRQQGIQVVTVNTQASNQASRHLYRRFGFVDIGEEIPVWEALL